MKHMMGKQHQVVMKHHHIYVDTKVKGHSSLYILFTIRITKICSSFIIRIIKREGLDLSLPWWQEWPPCTTYDPSVALSNADESCFICTTINLVNELCPYCKMCFASKNSCINDIPTTMLVMNPESSYILYIHHAAWI